ncbi:hypothetical protein BCR34DRAFT_560048, partial [Clohesyomyces aquaticus]
MATTSAQEAYELRPAPTTGEPQLSAAKNMAAESSSLRNSTHSSLTVREPILVHLKRNLYPLLIFIFYCTLALLAWTFSCILSQRPLRGGGSYTEPGKRDYLDDIQKRYDNNEKYIRAAQVLRSIVTLLTIPVTSAICSMAAVAYMQGGTGNGRRSLSLGQLMALADQGWISPRTWSRILDNGAKVASLPFFVALALTLIGSTAVILQDSLITTSSILGRTGNPGQYLGSLVDIPILFADTDSRDMIGYDVYQLRSLLESSSKYDAQPNMWVEKTPSPAPGALSEEPTYYYSEVPADFNTGVYRAAQFAPRINSTAKYNEISAEEFDCRNETENGGFYAAYGTYGSRYPSQGYAFIACMPGDQRTSPWKPTRDRQDISESLYLNISDIGGHTQYFRATMQTSLGYFELPSAGNNNTVGPLLAKDPFQKDSPQFTKKGGLKPRDGVWGTNTTFPGNETLITVRNKPPLLTLALALFGPKSYIDSRTQHTAAYVDTRPAWLDDNTRRPGTQLCVGLRPFDIYLEKGCVRDYDTLATSDGDQDTIFFSWNSIFTEQGFRSRVFQDALGMGAALANRIWIERSIDKRQYDLRTLRIFHDEGIKTVKVDIVGGNVGIIFGSVLFGCYLLALTGLVAYTCVVKTWAGELGSEVMVKVGASYAQQLTGVEGKRVYDVLSGCVGDAKPDNGIGRLEMGARTGLSGSRKYENF